MNPDDFEGEQTSEGATDAPNPGTGVEAEPSENSGAEATGRSDEEAPWESDAPDRGAGESEEENEEGDDDEEEEGDEDEEDGEDEEDFGDFSGRVGVGVQTGKDNVAAGTYIKKQVIKRREDEPVIAKLGRRTIARLRGVFARPDGYKDFLGLEGVREHRIIAVYGPKRSGKLTCAINLACDLWGEGDHPPKIYLYKRGADETRSLREAIQSKSAKRGTVVILEEVFESRVARRELEPPELSDFEEVLQKKECFVLLTARAEDPGFFLGAAVGARVRDLRRVLKAQLDYLQKQEKWTLGDKIVDGVLAKWPAFKSRLHNPAQIERFCSRFAKSPPRTVDEIEKLAEQALVASSRALQEWFGSLRSNEKLLAMLVYLFNGGERQLVEDFYRKAVHGLREEGLGWLVDPREMGFSDMLEAVEVQDLGGLIEFKDGEFEEEVAAQVENWAHLVWSVLDPLVKEVRPGQEWDSWQPRRGLGNALGRMAPHGRKSFTAAVDHLAGQGWDKAAVVAGYALEESVRRDFNAQSGLVIEKLLSWIDSGKPALMWAAGASLARAYAATVGQDTTDARTALLQRHLMDLLRHLIERSATFSEETKAEVKRQGEVLRRMGHANRKCAWKTATRILLLDSGRAPLLGVWLQDRSKFLREVARKAITQSFKKLSGLRYKPGEARHLPFLDLVEPALAAAGRGELAPELVDQVFKALKSWLRWPSWYEPIFQALLGVANRGSSEVRAKLRAVLSRLWLHRGSDQEAEKAFKIAQAVIARAYAMDGILMDRPRFGRCVFVLDPTLMDGDEESRDHKEKVYRHLLGILEAQVDVSVIHLGSRQAVQLKEKIALPLAIDHPVPSLVMPALEAACTADTRLILVLTARRLWDLEDVAGRPWAKDFIVVASGDDVGECEGVETISIGEDPRPEEVAKVEKALQGRWARALAKAGPWDWWHVLESFGLGEEIGDGPRLWLDRLVGALSDTCRATGHGDVARQLLCIVGWYAARDLRACAGLLRSWLERPVENGPMPFRQWMGAAGARALLSIHSAEPPSPEDSAPEILFEELAVPLALESRDGSEAVLHAVRQWIEEPLWAEYLAGDVVEGRGRLLRWAEKFAPQHANELRRLLPEPKPTPTAPFEDGWESLTAMMERLRRRAELGQPKTLPELAQGESYALIVLNSSDLNAGTSANFDTVVIDFLRSLHRQNGHGLKPVVYRLGERRPVWVTGVPPERDDLNGPETPRQPQLLGPILMDSRLSPACVKFVVVLSRQPLLDADDWLGTKWRDRIFFYSAGADEENHPGFATIPALAGSPVGGSIARFLLRNSTGEEERNAAASGEASAA